MFKSNHSSQRLLLHSKSPHSHRPSSHARSISRLEHSSSRSIHRPFRLESSPSYSSRSSLRPEHSPSRSGYQSPRAECLSSSSHRGSSHPEQSLSNSYCLAPRIDDSHRLCQSSEDYPIFHIHSSDYQIVFVNKYTSTELINKLLDHVNTCKQYSIDTESERGNNRLSLIQINSIHSESKSLVILFELNHFPDSSSTKYENIHRLFRLIFRKGNEVYSWGNMKNELAPMKESLIWPITAELIDIQPYFAAWYDWARTQCGVQSLLYRNKKNDDNEIIQQHHQTSLCSCHIPTPYKNNQLWSLQNAFKYGCNLFIDKSCTLSRWSSILSSSRASLKHEDRMKMIHYATHDVMAVTFLIRPITENWTFEKIKNRKMNEMFMAFNSIKLPPLPITTSTKKRIKNINVQKLSKMLRSTDSDVESISSDDEIYLNQLNEPIVNDYHPQYQNKNDNVIQDADDENVELEIEIPTADFIMDDNNNERMEDVNHYTVEVNEVDEPPKLQQQNNRKRRSAQGKQKKNRKRNIKLRSIRFQYSFTRPYYYKFKSRFIRRVLRYYGIEFRHIKKVQDRVIIGTKTDQARRDYEKTLPYHCFNKNNYDRFSK